MNYRTYISAIFLLAASVLISSCQEKKTPFVLIETNLGDIKIQLYDDTPGHRDNFLKLVEEGFYDGIKFHRIIEEFMIQAGNPATKYGDNTEMIQKYNYQIPAEITDTHFHKKGSLAAARTGNKYNPEMKSSGTQFYIVQGKSWDEEGLSQQEMRINNSIREALYYKYLAIETEKAKAANMEAITDSVHQEILIRMEDEIIAAGPYVIPEDRKEVYKTLGGTPHLDKSYTVFGEVVEGLDIVDQIAAVETGRGDVPVEEVTILRMRTVRK